LGASSRRHRILFGTCTWLSPEPANLLATEVVGLVGDDVAADWLHRQRAVPARSPLTRVHRRAECHGRPEAAALLATVVG
jgi:hypothetical protein